VKPLDVTVSISATLYSREMLDNVVVKKEKIYVVI